METWVESTKDRELWNGAIRGESVNNCIELLRICKITAVNALAGKFRARLSA